MKMPAKPKTLRAVEPNLGFELAYKKQLFTLIEAMHKSLSYWIAAAYRRADPEMVEHMAQDAAPRVLRDAIRRLTRRWMKQFNELGPELARYFAQGVAQRTDEQLQAILKKAGITVDLKLTRAAREVIQATVHENVALIRSIGQEHLNAVEGIVMRSVAQGRDLETVSKALNHQFGVTKRRAALIARHQNNIATANVVRLRQVDAGITHATWVHSGGGRHPRPTHVKAGRDKVIYDVAEGWYDPAIKRRIWPGTEINCRCVAKSIVPGFS
jgi:uncharacterized protein with gpF-like domain